ncbi:MAG: molecular chaperone TorD family protein [Myxococcales bacterium]|nr:molecular chaperone TorD family protein [Myxococcales bacterium]
MIAVARHRGYALFGRLFAQGLTPDVHAALAQLPAVGDVLPTPSDTVAAAHHEALSLDVFPYASVFLEPAGTLGGATSAEVSQRYAQGGFHPSTASMEADHLALQLAYLAHLCAAEAQAVEDGVEAEPLVVLQRGFLGEHLLRWLPPLSVALTQQARHPLLARVGQLTLELAASHLSELGGDVPPTSLPEPALSLSDPDTRLKDVVGYLVSPARSGVYLSRSGIAEVAQQVQLPTGFGTRPRMLEQLLHTASDHHRQPELLGALASSVSRFREGLGAARELGVDVDAWVQRGSQTLRVLDEMKAALPG